MTMNHNQLSIVFLLLCFFSTSAASSDDPITLSTGEVSINCGSIQTEAGRNGRKWQGDGQKSFSLVKIKGSSTTSYVINQELVSDPVPYQTARISRSQFSYQIQINPGQKILRLHFKAAPYKGFRQYKDLFDVEAGPFTLLGNFSATLVADALGVSSIVKEFCMDIEENQMFNITFTPASSQSRDTYAFINGIEILSVPASRSYFHIDQFLDGQGPLKGSEILKLNNPENSLVSSNPLPFLNPPTFQILAKVVGHQKTIVSIAILVLVLLSTNLYMLLMLQKAGLLKEKSMPSVKVGRLCREFSLTEIQLATKNFSPARIIGSGGFGKVYKGTIDNGQQTVAIKRSESNSGQGELQFWREIETLTELRHVNLVSLIGYCNEGEEMILVYEHMKYRSLADHLFKIVCDDDDIPSRTWKRRLNICIGAARGLDYLHTGHSIIHRDVKASNILLDENFTAKVSDFGLAKPLTPEQLQQSHVCTGVKGTRGYLDPEYIVTGKLTRKSDVYAFGVVLFEVLSGRRILDRQVLPGEHDLVKWAKENIRRGTIDRVVDLRLRGEISDDSLKAFVGVAEKCLQYESKNRPTMAEVALQLQSALELQKSSKSASKGRINNQTAVSTDMKFVGVPAIPFNELKDTLHNIGQNSTSDDDFLHGVLRSGQDAAIKVLKHKTKSDQKFLQQVSIMSSLKHQNLVKLLGYSMNGALRILVHEYAPRGSLHDFLHVYENAHGPTLTWSQKVKIAVGAARGLEYLHGKGHVHFNVRSSNLLLFPGFEVKITNIGLENPKYEEPIGYREAFGYQAPEFINGEPTSKTDVYNFGVVLLELLTGIKPSDMREKFGIPRALFPSVQDLGHYRVSTLAYGRVKFRGLEYPPGQVDKMVRVAYLCTQLSLDSRPKMSAVATALETLLDVVSPPKIRVGIY